MNIIFSRGVGICCLRIHTFSEHLDLDFSLRQRSTNTDEISLFAITVQTNKNTIINLN